MYAAVWEVQKYCLCVKGKLTSDARGGMRMYNKHLDSFIAIAEAGSFSAAADRLFISRTALIQQINLLEKDLGFQVFDRHSKGVTLTETGRYFYGEAKKIVRLSRKALARCRAMEETPAECIRIGTLPNFTAVLLPKLCRRFTERYPNIKLHFIEYPLERYFAHFANNQFDITTEYMSGYVFEEPDYRFIKLMEDRHCCGVSPRHPLARQKKLTLQDLRGQKVMIYARGITRADDRLRDYLTETVPDIECIDIKQYNSSLPLKCELEGLVLIYYSMYWESFPTLVTLPLSIDFPIDIGLGYKADCNASVRQFIALAQELFDDAATRRTREELGAFATRRRRKWKEQ